MTRLRDILFVMAVCGLSGAAYAQEPDLPPGPPLEIDVQTIDTAPPEGERLSLVAEVVAVPVVLEQVIATVDQAVASVRVRNTAAVPLTQVTLAVTAVRLAGGVPVRRTLGLAVALGPGATQTVDVGLPASDLLAVWLPGETGVIDVAVVGAQAADGSAVEGDVGPPGFLPATALVACGDTSWHASAPGETITDAQSGELLQCDSHGRWRVPVVEGAQ